MGKTIEVITDRAFDQTKTILPAEVARGTYMQNPPSLSALKIMHFMIATAGGRMGEDVEHIFRLSELRAVPGLRHHDRSSLTPLFAELQSAVMISDNTQKQRVTIGGLLDIAEIDYREEVTGDLVISWYFSRMFTRAAANSNHWAILDRQTVFHLNSKYSVLLFQYISSLVNLDHTQSRTFTVQELRALLGVPETKHKRFAELNRWTIKPAVAEINQISRITLYAIPNKVGRTIVSVTIGWEVKADPQQAKQELSYSKVGRKERQKGSLERLVTSFPSEGSIEYDKRWRGLKTASGCNMDNTMIADRFRAFCKERNIKLDTARIEQIFTSFCTKIGKV